MCTSTCYQLQLTFYTNKNSAANLLLFIHPVKAVLFTLVAAVS